MRHRECPHVTKGGTKWAAGLTPIPSPCESLMRSRPRATHGLIVVFYFPIKGGEKGLAILAWATPLPLLMTMTVLWDVGGRTDELIALPTPHPQDERGRGGDDVGWWTMRCLAWRGKIAIISAVRAFSSSWGTKAALLSRQPGCRLLPLAQ